MELKHGLSPSLFLVWFVGAMKQWPPVIFKKHAYTYAHMQIYTKFQYSAIYLILGKGMIKVCHLHEIFCAQDTLNSV